MNSALDSFINGIFFAFGTIVVSTFFGFIIFKLTRNWLTKTIAEIWTKVKTQSINLDGIEIKGQIKQKKKR